MQFLSRTAELVASETPPPAGPHLPVLDSACMGEMYQDGHIGRGVLAGSDERLWPKNTPYSPPTSLNMAGSNIFSFITNKRKPKALRERIFEPLTPAEIRHVGASAADDAYRSAMSGGGRPGEELRTSRPSLTSTTIHDAASLYSLPTTTSRANGQMFPDRQDGPIRSQTVSIQQQNKLNREPSSSTLRSYYDRKKSPLAVSQQTSASSARDFALRKGCRPVISTSLEDISHPKQSDSASITTEAALKRRPARLDFSTLFSKPLPQSGPLLSPQRYTHSPPPLSPTSEMPSEDHQPPALPHDKLEEGLRQQLPLYFMPTSQQSNTSGNPYFAQRHVQRPPLGMRNWFDDFNGENDADCGPGMQPSFIETAFQTASSNMIPNYDSRPKHDPGEHVRFNQSRGHLSRRQGEKSSSPEVKPPDEGALREASDNWEVKPKHPIADKQTPARRSQSSSFNAFNLADLQEQSVLCLSSSDDEDDNIQIEEVPRLGEQGPYLRDSLGADSIDSDFEIGTAQAVNPSFLGTFKPRIQPKNLRGGSSIKTRSNIKRPRGVETPDRHSSKRGVSLDNDQLMLSSPDDDILGGPGLDVGDRESLSSKHSTRTAPTMMRRRSPLLIVLTPQEASLLGAMRSKRASMRRNIRPNEEAFPKPPIVPYPSTGQNYPSRSIENKAMNLEPDSVEARNYYAHAISIEPSPPSVPVSLVFSEGVSSLTDDRDSPTTPPLDGPHDANAFQKFRDDHGTGLHQVKMNQFGHSGSQTGDNQFIGPDHFRKPQKEAFASEEYPWALGALTERVKTAMIH